MTVYELKVLVEGTKVYSKDEIIKLSLNTKFPLTCTISLQGLVNKIFDAYSYKDAVCILRECYGIVRCDIDKVICADQRSPFFNNYAIIPACSGYRYTVEYNIQQPGEITIYKTNDRKLAIQYAKDAAKNCDNPIAVIDNAQLEVYAAADIDYSNDKYADDVWIYTHNYGE